MSDTVSLDRPQSSATQRYPMFSTDEHIDIRWLPKDLWSKRLPRHLLERGPKVIDTPAGDLWVCDGVSWGAWGATLGSMSGKKWAVGDVEDGVLTATNPAARLKDMDRDGIEASVIFGPVTPLGIKDPELRIACYRAYNDWLLEFCASSPDRLLGVGFLPVEDPQEAIAEAERMAKTSLKQVNLMVARTLTPVHSAPWLPFWDAMNDLPLLVSSHFGIDISRVGQPGEMPQTTAAARIGLAKGWVQFIDPLIGLFSNGVLEKRPGVRWVLAESGAGWIPYLMQRIDQRYEEVLADVRFWDAHGGVPIEMMPSDVFKRQVWVTFTDDLVAMSQLSFFGEDKMMWASDYPHPDSSFPHSWDVVQAQMTGLSEGLKRKLTYDNAKALYGSVK
jgi:predicted TIM-barrel fold metal-dependent hydrolase